MVSGGRCVESVSGRGGCSVLLASDRAWASTCAESGQRALQPEAQEEGWL